MFSKKIFYHRLRILIFISFIWMLFAALFYYNITGIEGRLLTQANLPRFLTAFGIIGLVVTSTLVLFLKSAFARFPIWISMLFKLLITLFLFFLLSFILAAVYYLLFYKRTFPIFVNHFFNHIFFTKAFFILIADMGLMTLLSIVLSEVTDIYEPGTFWRLLTGKYQKPKNENRIFLFLDINSSTTIAEEIGHKKYFPLLRDFFRDVGIAVISNDGAIYQYVGDEIVVSWKNTPENKIKCLKFIRNTYYLLQRRSKKYMRRYGYIPSFKCGVHAGEVASGFIGVIKRELVYSGDTLNTTARITSSCNDLNVSYLLSEDFMQDFYQPFSYTITEIGEIELKGKQEMKKLYSLTFE